MTPRDPGRSIPIREIRRRLRALPRERRKDVLAAVREGRSVHDPRDAALTVDWAETLDAKRRAWVWPWWILPRSQPSGWRAWAWLVHVVWITTAIAVADATLWRSLPGIWRWVVIGVLAYGLVSTPITIRRMLRAYWNAPEAARRNRQLLERD
jgi:hypothetical protein